MPKKFYLYSNIFAWGLVLFLIGNYVFGWTTPTAAPPAGNITLQTGATPAGSTGYVQFNNAGALGGDAGLFWDNTNKRLGIGTTEPAGKLGLVGSYWQYGFDTGVYPAIGRLWYQSDGSGYGFSIGRKDTGGTYSDYVYIKDGGNVGIGTTNPSYLLDLDVGNVTNNMLRSRGRYPSMIMEVVRSNPSDTGAAFNIFDLRGTNSVGTTNLIKIGALAGMASSSVPTFNYLYFGNDYYDTSMVIDYNKNVGIGTTAPGAKLDVVGYILSDVNSLEGGLYLGNSSHGIRRLAATNNVETYTTSGNLYFSANGAGSNQITLLNNGNVGIGTTAPSYKLNVNGDIYAAGYTRGGIGLCIGGDCRTAWPTSSVSCYTFESDFGNYFNLNQTYVWCPIDYPRAVASMVKNIQGWNSDSMWESYTYSDVACYCYEAALSSAICQCTCCR